MNTSASTQKPKAPNPTESQDPSAVEELRREISAHLFATYGPMIGRRDLYKLLGFSSVGAFDRSVSRRHVDLPLFKLPARAGVYVLTPDLVRYLVASATAKEGCHAGEEEHDREK